MRPLAELDVAPGVDSVAPILAAEEVRAVPAGDSACRIHVLDNVRGAPTGNSASRIHVRRPASPDELCEIKRDLAERCRALRRAPAERAQVLAETCRRWRERRDPFRLAGIRSLVEQGGFAPETAAAGLDAMLRPWDERAWVRLARSELGSGSLAADGRAGTGALPSHASAGVVPHVLGSALPAPNFLPLLLTLLAGKAPLARAGRWLPDFPAVVLASLGAVDPELGALGAVCRWPRERADLTLSLFAASTVGSVTGSDGAVAAVRSLLEPGTRLLEHPHRLSLACVCARAARAGRPAAGSARRLARDVALHDQLGCLSPVGVVVEGGAVAAERFARALACALAERAQTWPRSAPRPHEAARVRAFHDVFALAPAAGRTRVLAGEALGWVVGVLAAGDSPPAPALYRCVWVLPVRDLAQAAVRLAALRGVVAALGFRGSAKDLPRARALARALDATRLAPLGRMQSPPLGWRRDGVAPLGSLVA